MACLDVALQDGFADDEVVVDVNGEEVFREADVTTRPETSLAAGFQVEVPEGSTAQVHVRLPQASVAGEVDVPIKAETAWLGVSRTLDGPLRFDVSAQPFGYV